MEDPDGTAESVAQLQRRLLSWDYVDLCQGMDKGNGLGANLTPVPTAFTSIEVVNPVPYLSAYLFARLIGHMMSLVAFCLS